MIKVFKLYIIQFVAIFATEMLCGTFFVFSRSAMGFIMGKRLIWRYSNSQHPAATTNRQAKVASEWLFARKETLKWQSKVTYQPVPQML